IMEAAWLLAWHTHALTTAPSGALHPNAFHPSPYSVFYSPPALGPLPIFAPVYLATGSVPLAYDVAFLGGIVLTALGVAAIVGRWTGDRHAAFVAGLVVATSPALRGSAGSAPLCASLAALPWLIAAVAAPELRRAGGLVIVAAVALQALVDPMFALP